MIDEKIFKAYDVRGLYPEQLNEDIAYKIAVSYAQKVKPDTVIVGKDVRTASDAVYDKLIEGLVDQGVNVKAAGRMTNPMIGFGTWFYDYDGGLIASASHNPVGYGGIKMMQKGAVSIAGEDTQLKTGVLEGDFAKADQKGSVEEVDIKADYIKFLRDFVEIEKLTNIKVFLDPLYGAVGIVIKDLLRDFPIEPIYNNADPDSRFGGLAEPNPLNSEVRKGSIESFKSSGAEFGVIWDGDGDRCFFLDERGEFVDAPYITALITEHVLSRNPGAKVVGDPRIIWPIEQATSKNGGEFVLAKSGYRFIKEKMAEVDAVFGAEMTAHYFFKEDKNCDNGIIPFLIVLGIVCETGKKLSELVAPYKQNHVLIEEVKLAVEDPSEMIKKIKGAYSEYNQSELDGLTIESEEFRFNLRASNTEPVAKLNMEAKTQEIIQREKDKLLNVIGG